MARPVVAGDRGMGLRMIGLGFLLMVGGVAGAAYAWFPAPPHSATAPMEGWPGRWFASGVGWFGLVLAITGLASLRAKRNASHSLVWTARAAIMLAAVCFVLCFVSLVLK